MDPIIAALIEEQGAAGLGNNEFARMLGVDKATWSCARRGLQGPGHVLIRAAMRVFPRAVSRALSMEESIDVDVENPQPAEVA